MSWNMRMFILFDLNASASKDGRSNPIDKIGSKLFSTFSKVVRVWTISAVFNPDFLSFADQHLSFLRISILRFSAIIAT
ncbi:hypothetical protein CS542_06900 [Pedobacter sp. IW39]|nr:hypothetical protein CS542_06900 [Pedobacter sp. IW39]